MKKIIELNQKEMMVVSGGFPEREDKIFVVGFLLGAASGGIYSHHILSNQQMSWLIKLPLATTVNFTCMFLGMMAGAIMGKL